MRSKTFKRSLQFTILIASILPILYIGIYMYHAQTNSFLTETKIRSTNLINTTETLINQFNESSIGILKNFATHPIITSAISTPLKDSDVLPVIMDYYNDYSSIESIYLGTEDGRHYSRKKSLVLPTYDPRTRPWYQLALSKPGYVMLTESYENAAAPGTFSIAYSLSVLDEKSGEIKGVVGCDVNLTNLKNSIAGIENYQGTTSLVADSNGVIIFGQETDLQNRLKQDPDKISTIIKNGSTDSIMLFGEKYNFYTKQISSTGWNILVFVPYDLLQSKYSEILVTIGSLMLIVFFISWIFSLLLVRLLTKQLDFWVEKIRKFRLDTFAEEIPIDINTPYEFKVIGETLNDMFGRIQQQANELNQQKEEISGQYEHITKLYTRSEEMNTALNNLIAKLRESNRETILALTNAIEANDNYTKGHCNRVNNYALLLGEYAGLSQIELETLETASILHDVGKVGVPTDILNKPCSYTEQEYEVVKKHVDYGYMITHNISFLENAAQIIRHHHEQYDGNGYPDGIKGYNISKSARILCIADAFDAMTSARVYRPIPLATEKAIEELILYSNIQFDPILVDLFINKVLNDKRVNFMEGLIFR